ncbi:MAG: hypothetical protein SFW09_02350 [Hyphomicrobiaceae bacterium]|nr:hypothetical protein [Hyphomicrobiaceae bacterium]
MPFGAYVLINIVIGLLAVGSGFLAAGGAGVSWTSLGMATSFWVVPVLWIVSVVGAIKDHRWKGLWLLLTAPIALVAPFFGILVFVGCLSGRCL